MFENKQIQQDINEIHFKMNEAHNQGNRDGEYLDNYNFSNLLYSSYRNAQRYNQEYLDLHDAIFTGDIPPFVEALKKYGIKQFTISSGYSGLISVLFKFHQLGYKVSGMTEIPFGTSYNAVTDTERPVYLPALLLTAEEA